jgi:7-cyano-7-deazaguanine synthase in queuosine biosynthesis
MLIPDENGDLAVAKWESVTNHVLNIHEHDSELYPHCTHEVIERAWLDEGKLTILHVCSSVMLNFIYKKIVTFISREIVTNCCYFVRTACSSYKCYHKIQ